MDFWAICSAHASGWWLLFADSLLLRPFGGRAKASPMRGGGRAAVGGVTTLAEYFRLMQLLCPRATLQSPSVTAPLKGSQYSIRCRGIWPGRVNREDGKIREEKCSTPAFFRIFSSDPPLWGSKGGVPPLGGVRCLATAGLFSLPFLVTKKDDLGKRKLTNEEAAAWWPLTVADRRPRKRLLCNRSCQYQTISQKSLAPSPKSCIIYLSILCCGYHTFLQGLPFIKETIRPPYVSGPLQGTPPTKPHNGTGGT